MKKRSSKTAAKAVAKIERSFTGLRDALFDELDALRAGTAKPDRANAVSRLASEVSRSVSVQIDVIRLSGGKVRSSATLLAP